jgi:hypothetical protein
MCQIGSSTEIMQRIYAFRVILGIIGDLLPYQVLINADADFLVWQKKMCFYVLFRPTSGYKYTSL